MRHKSYNAWVETHPQTILLSKTESSRYRRSKGGRRPPIGRGNALSSVPAPPPSPPGLVIQTTANTEPAKVNVESLQALVPTPEQISAYLAQERKMKAEKKRARMNNLITQAF